jgi:hypothetical protein
MQKKIMVVVYFTDSGGRYVGMYSSDGRLREERGFLERGRLKGRNVIRIAEQV